MTFDTEESPFDPAARQLCPDGACIGLMGPDGRCSECGRTEEQAQSGHEPEEEVGLEASPEETDEPRELCSDGACIGLLGPDRCCKVCGLPAQQT